MDKHGLAIAYVCFYCMRFVSDYSLHQVVQVSVLYDRRNALIVASIFAYFRITRERLRWWGCTTPGL